MKNNKKIYTTLILTLFLSSISVSLFPSGDTQAEPVTYITGSTAMTQLDDIDPAIVRRTFDSLNIAEKLVEYLSRNNSFVWQLATGVTPVNDTAFDVQLRENVLFHDGTPFNAAAVKWNYDRIAYITDPNGGNETSLMAFHWMNISDIRVVCNNTSILTWVPDDALFRRVNSTTVMSEYVVRIHVNDPSIANLQSFYWTEEMFVIISPTYYAAFETKPFYGGENFTATGPYKFTHLDLGIGEFRLDAFEDYWGGKPYIDTIIQKNYLDQATIGIDLLAGDLDMGSPAGDPNDYDNEFLDVIPGEKSSITQTIVLNNLVINQTIRKALSYAFPYDSYIYNSFEDGGVRSSGVFWDWDPYYDPTIPLAYENLTIARQVLIDAGLVPANATDWSDEDWRLKAVNDPIFEFDYLHTVDASFTEQSGIQLIIGARNIGIKCNSVPMTNDGVLGIVFSGARSSTAAFLWVWPYEFSTDIIQHMYRTLRIDDLGTNWAFVMDANMTDDIKYAHLCAALAGDQEAIAKALTDQLQNEIYPMIWMSQTQGEELVTAKYTWNDDWGSGYMLYYEPVESEEPEPTPGPEIPGFPLGIIGLVSIIGIIVLMKKVRK